MENGLKARFSIVAVLLLATACQGSGGGGSVSPAPGQAQGAPQSCARSCNVQYDACMDRFGGAIGGPSATGRLGGGSSSSPDAADTCPDQLKSCLRSCY